MIEEILKKLGEELALEMKMKVPRVSGKTADSIEVQSDATSFTILGDKTIGALINGRKPTSASAPKGSPTLQEKIFEWIKIKGIQPNEPSMSQLSLSWAISKSIHKNGYKGKGNFFEQVLNQNRIDKISDALLTKVSEATSNIIKDLKL